MTAPLPAPQSVDELRAALLKAHGTTVGKDDPVLMVYTIHRTALDEIAQAMDAARASLRDAVTEASALHTAEMHKALDAIGEAVASNALRERLAAMQEAAVLADRSAAGMRKSLRHIAILSACTWLGAMLSFAAVFVVLR